MAATAATLTFQAKGGRKYFVDAYVPDAAAGQWGFNPTGAATSGSLTFYTIPEDVVLVDVSALAVPTATGATLYANQAAVNGGQIRIGNFLYSNPMRPQFNIGFSKGSIISAVNVA